MRLKVLPLQKEHELVIRIRYGKSNAHVIVFFSVFLGSGLARFSTLRKSEVFARMRE